MKSGKIVWFFLNLTALACLFITLFLGIVSLSVDDWIRINVKTAGRVTAYTQMDRVRGLWRECVLLADSGTFLVFITVFSIFAKYWEVTIP